MTDGPTPNFDLTGRTAVVTGGSRGLGRAMVRALAQAGARVVIASRDAGACEELAREVTDSTGNQVFGLGLHVGRWDDLDAFTEEVYQATGSVDVLVNNAGMSPLYGEVTDLSEELFDKVLDVNLKGPFRLAALIGRRMKEAGSGSIINISSAASLRPRPDVLHYAAAKAGLNAVTIGLAHTLGPEVRVNAIVAGTFLTDVSKAWDMDAFAERAAGFASQRGGDPEEITGMVLYLASDASSYTTGALLNVDGGHR